MNYDLAKQLKAAGFPTKPEKHCNGCCQEHFLLSEMIEACGDRFSDLCLDKKEWKAYAIKDIRDEINTEWYETPEESVANSWLELNKKDGK